MGQKWEVENRYTCKICGGQLPNYRFRTYCSKACRTKAYNIKQRDSGYSKAYQRAKRAVVDSKPDPRKVQCKICNKWYVQVGSHVVQIHKMTARQYREEYGLDVKRGTVPSWYREKKGDQALENGTFKNLEAGKEYRFKKGQEGLGRYERSEDTIKRLRKLSTFKKSYAQDIHKEAE